MAANLNPYIGFRDNAREAINFYATVFGGETTVSTFGEFHASEDASEQEKIMHGLLKTPSGFTLMVADTPNAMPYNPGDNISISVSGDAADDAELRGYWDKLTDGGKVEEPLAVAPWGDSFGMATDRFGIRWLVNIAGS